VTDLGRAIEGQDLRVDFATIEKSLAELWRTESEDPDRAVTRAALWNVVAHTENDRDRDFAGETLAQASAAVPQRTIVVRANPAADPELAAWIGANCHLLGGEKQVCSEEITIVAGGERIYHVPPLVDALLIPELPVATWWVGGLPHDREDYVEALLDPSNRFIVDSAHFDTVEDLILFSRICTESNTEPADLNWERLEEWRIATASVFDPVFMRPKLYSIRSLRIVSAISDEALFGDSVEGILYAAWIGVQLGYQFDREGYAHGRDGRVDFRFEKRRQASEVGAVVFVEIQFSDGSSVRIDRNREHGMLKVDVAGIPESAATVTRTMPRDARQLIVRQLSHAADDPIFRKVLGPATLLARHSHA
jgi:glucose-6-phosphate dehydrogenase assembly protein OpcA